MSANLDESGAAVRYSRESDFGRTSLGDVGEVSKGDIRLEAFAGVEEANTAIGHALAMGAYDVAVNRTLTSVQNDLFDLAADLLAPSQQHLDPQPLRIEPEHVNWVSRAWQHFSEGLEPVSGFIIPGGTVAASFLYQARVVVRRAERTLIKLIEEHPDDFNPLTASYLNAVSSLLFALARRQNAQHGDLMWHPRVSITPPDAG